MVRFFNHLTEREEAQVSLSLGLFGLVLVVSTVFLITGRHEQATRLKHRTIALQVRLENLAQLKAQRDEQHWLFREAAEIFFQIHDRLPSTHADTQRVRALATEYLRPMLTSSPPEDAEYVNGVLRYAAPLLDGQFPLHHFRVPLTVWSVLGLLYWMAVYTLYRNGLRPSTGEAAFNILDLSFVAVLVQYSGGFGSPFFAVFLFSLFLSAADFGFQERKPEHCERPLLTKLALVLGPYIIALFVNIFWAVSDEVLQHNEPLRSYLRRWGQYSLIGVGAWLGFYLVVRHFLHRPITEPTVAASHGVA